MVSVELLPKGIDLQEDEESEKIKQIDRTVNDDLDDFQDKPNEKKLSRRLPKEEDGNQWFQGPIDNNNLSKLRKFLREPNVYSAKVGYACRDKNEQGSCFAHKWLSHNFLLNLAVSRVLHVSDGDWRSQFLEG